MIDINNPLYQEDLCYVSPYLDALYYENKKNVLVTGATGLIGSFIVDALIYYNEHSGREFKIYAMGRSIERLKKRFGNSSRENLIFIEKDINDGIEDGNDYDIIFHLASNADPGMYESQPYETIKTNVQGAINIIEYAKLHKNSEILFTSTMEVYGEIQKDALVESDYGAINHNNLRAGYPESKRVSELMYRSAVREYGINAKIARLGYIYGPTMSDTDNKIIAEFIRKKTNNETIELKSAGTQRRTYCYVSDAVTGILTVLKNGENGQAYNVADMNSEVTLKELANIFGANSDNGRVETKQVYDTVLNTGMLQKLGWKAFRNLEDGVKHSIKCIKRGIE